MAEANTSVLRRWVEGVFNGGDTDAVDAIFTPGFEMHDPGFPAPVVGPAGVRQLLSVYRTAFPDVRITIEDMISEGDKGVARLTFRGTHVGSFGDVPPTGRSVTMSSMIFCRFREGRIDEMWRNGDQLGLLRQLGVLPSPS
jgi:steroid delta-isomerase-like uncharacterized protein